MQNKKDKKLINLQATYDVVICQKAEKSQKCLTSYWGRTSQIILIFL